MQITESHNSTAVIYARYSSHAQRDVSISQQIKECRAYAERLGLEVIGEYTDHAMTGTNDKRPEFQRMIADAQKGVFDYVIVYTLDRFARDRYDSAVYKRQLKTYGVRVLSAMENISDDPTGVLMESLLEGLAEYYSKELSRKIRRGMEDNAGKCLANGSLPYGYRRGKDGKFEIVESEAEIVREVYSRFARGDSFADIIRDFNARGIKTKSGVAWNKNSFSIMTTNERYTGTYIYGNTRIEGGVPPIIGKELFDRVQLKLTTKARPRNTPQKRRRENGTYLLTGKLFCGKCKAPMVGISGKSNAPELYCYYICQTRRKNKSCNKETVRREWAEHEIASALYDIALRDDVIEWLADCTIAYRDKHRESVVVSALRDQLSEVQRSIKNIMTAIEQGIITQTTKNRLTELEAEERSLKTRISLASEEHSAEMDVTKEQIVVWLESLRDGDVEDKAYQAMLIDTLLVRAYLYDDHFRIVFNFADGDNEFDLPFDIDSVGISDEAPVRLYAPPLHHDRERPPFVGGLSLSY